MKRVLLTGAAGNLGSFIEGELLQRELSVISCSREDLDVTDAAALASAFEATKPDLVVNAAGFNDPDLAESHEDECVAVNSGGAQYLARLCRDHAVPLVHLSCDWVFDTLLTRAHKENDPVHSPGVYGRSKIMAENFIQKSGCRGLIVRCGMPFGGGSPRDPLRRIISTALGGGALTVVSDELLTPVPCAALARSLSKICLMMLEDDSICGIAHYAGEPAVSHAEFVRTALLKAAGLGIIESLPEIREIRSCARKDLALRPLDPRLDVTNTVRDFHLAMPKWQDHLEAALKNGDYDEKI